MARTVAAGIARRSPPVAGRIFGLFTPHLNRFVARVAGSRFTPMWSLLRHRGRRSGRAYATPVTARRVGQGFTIGLAFGPRADWVRNVVAGGGSIRWRGRDYALASGEVRGTADPVLELPAWQQALYRRAGLTAFVYLRDAVQESPSPSSASA